MLVFALSTGVTGLYTARILQAIGGAIYWISAYTIAIDLSDGTDKAKKIGGIDESFARGGLIGGTIGFSLLSLYCGDNAWSVLFLIYAALGFAGSGIVLRKIPETNPNIAAKTKGKSHISMNQQLIKPVFIILLSTIAISTTSIMSSPIPMLLLQDQYTKDILALAATYVPISVLFSILPSRVGNLSDKIGRTIPICGGLIIVGIATLLIAAVHNYYLLIFMWALETAGISLLSPALAVLLTDKISSTVSTGSTYGLFTFTRSLGLIIGPIWGSWLYSSYSLGAFLISGCFTLGVVILAIWGLRDSKKNYKNIDTMAG
jgi:MFS family permease